MYIVTAELSVRMELLCIVLTWHWDLLRTVATGDESFWTVKEWARSDRTVAPCVQSAARLTTNRKTARFVLRTKTATCHKSSIISAYQCYLLAIFIIYKPHRNWLPAIHYRISVKKRRSIHLWRHSVRCSCFFWKASSPIAVLWHSAQNWWAIEAMMHILQQVWASAVEPYWLS